MAATIPTFNFKVNGKTTSLPDFNNVLNRIKNFYLTDGDKTSIWDKIKASDKDIEATLESLSTTPIQDLTNVLTISNQLEQAWNELDSIAKLESWPAGTLDRLRQADSIITSIFGSETDLTEEYGVYTINSAITTVDGTVIAVDTSLESVLGELESSSFALNGLVNSIGELEGTLESMGAALGVVGAVFAAGDIISQAFSAIHNALWPTPSLEQYFTVTSTFGAKTPTDMTNGFVKLMADVGHKGIYNMRGAKLIPTIQLALRDFVQATNAYASMTNSLGQATTNIGIIQTILGKLDHIFDTSGLETVANELDNTKDEIADRLIKLFALMKEISGYKTVQLGPTDNQVQLSKYSSPGTVDIAPFVRGRTYWVILQKIEAFINQVIDLQQLMTSFTNLIQMTYIQALAAEIAERDVKVVVTTVLGGQTVFPPVDVVPTGTDMYNPVPILDLEALMNGLIDLEALKSITDTKSAVITKTETEENNKKKKPKKKKKKEEKRKETEEGHITTIQFNYDPFSDKFSYIQFTFDAPSKKDSNKFGKIELIRKDGKKFTLGKGNRGAFSLVTTKIIKREQVRLSTMKQSVSQAIAKKYIESEINDKQYYTYK